VIDLALWCVGFLITFTLVIWGIVFVAGIIFRILFAIWMALACICTAIDWTARFIWTYLLRPAPSLLRRLAYAIRASY
jgi:hypothetical protein